MILQLKRLVGTPFFGLDAIFSARWWNRDGGFWNPNQVAPAMGAATSCSFCTPLHLQGFWFCWFHPHGSQVTLRAVQFVVRRPLRGARKEVCHQSQVCVLVPDACGQTTLLFVPLTHISQLQKGALFLCTQPLHTMLGSVQGVAPIAPFTIRI